MRYWIRLGAIGVAALAATCADLDPMDPALCGNLALDGGEDCDTYPEGQCGEPGSETACRFLCDRGSDDPSRICPEGWSCGVDGICRLHAGTFQELATFDQLGQARPWVGNFDGDELPDLVTSSSRQLTVFFGRAQQAPILGSAFAPVPAAPVVAELSADGLDDLVLLDDWMMVAQGQEDRSFQPTIYAPFFEPEPGLVAVLMDAMPEHLDEGSGQYVNVGDELLMFVGGSLLHGDATSQSTEGVTGVDGDPAEFSAQAQVGDVITWDDPDGTHEGIGCEELLFPLVGSANVELYAPCVLTEDSTVLNGTTEISVDDPVTMPPGMTIGPQGLILAQLNADDNLDLLVHCEGLPEDGSLYNSSCGGSTTPPPVGGGSGTGGMSPLGGFGGMPPLGGFGGMPPLGGFGGSGSDFGGNGAGGAPGAVEPFWSGVCVAYGLGDGTFDSWLAQDGANSGGANQAAPVNNPALAEFPLAVGDLNGDGVPDFVMRDALQISVVEGFVAGDPPPDLPLDCIQYRSIFYSNAGWDFAHVADFNGNGLVDVLAASQQQQALTFLNGTGRGVFNEFTVPLSGAPDLLAVGDFDGDLLLDVAFRQTEQTGDEVVDQDESGEQPGDKGDVLAVSYGNPFGAPSPPVAVGRLRDMAQVTAGNLSSLHYDGIDDLVVVTRSSDGTGSSVATLMGTTERALESPFFFRSERDVWDDSLEQFVLRDVQDLPMAAAVGRFDDAATGAAHPDVAVLTWEIPEELLRAQQAAGPNAADPNRDWFPQWYLWLLPSTGAAAIDRAEATATWLNELLPNDWTEDEYTSIRFDGTRATLTALDLDGDDVDELVMLGASYTFDNHDLPVQAEAEGLLTVWRAGSDGWSLDPAGPQPLPEIYQQRSGTGTASSSSSQAGGQDEGDPGGVTDEHDVYVEFDSRVIVADLFGDGHPDLLTLGATVELADIGLGTSNIEATAVQREMFVYRNQGLGSLTIDDRIPLAIDSAVAPFQDALMDFALLNIDGDADPEVALLTPEAVFFAALDLVEGRLVVDADKKLEGNFAPGQRLAAADFDGDGLDDLVVVDFDKAVLFRGLRWVRP